MSSPINPEPFLHDLVGQDIAARLKWGSLELRGKLKSVDKYMNLQLINTEEWTDSGFKGVLGEILIRCNNVLYIRGVSSEEKGLSEQSASAAQSVAQA